MGERFLVVKLADVGDLLTATPALRLLRRRFPSARIDLLAPPHSAEVVRGLTSVDDLVLFRKALYDAPLRAARPTALLEALRLARRLRTARYDAVLILHHLTTRWGSLKYAALAASTGSPRRVGLDNGLGYGRFLTDRAPDGGFGASHEVDYWLRVVDLLGSGSGETAGVADPRVCISDGGATADEDAGSAAVGLRQTAKEPYTPRLEVATDPGDEAVAGRLLGGAECLTVAIHPGSGGFSVARRWSPAGFAAVGNSLAERQGARIVLVGGPDEADLCREVARGLDRPPLVLAGRTSLKQLAAVLRRCDLLVSNDSGVMHLAVAVGTPVVAVFGLSNHRAWGPYGFQEWPVGSRPVTGSLVVRVDLPCSPCFYRGHSMGSRFGCATRDCLRQVAPEAVVAAAEAVLLRRRSSPVRLRSEGEE